MPPPALLLHGFLGRGADWAPVARHLGETRRVLAPDLVGREGWGLWDRDPPDAEPFDVDRPRPGSLAWAADRLAGTLDAARLGAVDLAGYSMGGRLALLFALRHPAWVRRLVLVSASPGLRTLEERAARRGSDAALARDLERDFPAFLDRWLRLPLFASLSDAQRTRLAADRLAADRLAHGHPEALAGALVSMGTGAMPSLWEPLKTIPAETHAVVGALDPTYVALARAMGNRVRVHVVPDAGHNLLAEAPGPLTDLLVRLFH